MAVYSLLTLNTKPHIIPIQYVPLFLSNHGKSLSVALARPNEVQRGRCRENSGHNLQCCLGFREQQTCVEVFLASILGFRV